MLRTFFGSLLLASLVAACAGSGETQAPTSTDVEIKRPTAPAVAAPPTTSPLPLDPQVRLGRLDNGLTYYIRHNEKPKDRAELRLAVDAGSVLEDDDQRGLAHFVEHMAFNGTERYPKQELIDYLELTGTRFGADLNAYTSLDETVYQLTVRTDSLDLLHTGIEVLREWAGRISFAPEEIEKERGVVIEEWRLGRGANMRIFNEQLPVLMKGSKYAERLPIGNKETLESFEHETMIRFYREWYRPELMAVLVVGQVDVDDIEARIKREFSTLTASTTPVERPTFGVPPNEEPLITVVTDPEAPFSSVSLVFKLPKKDRNSVAAYREDLVERLYHGMFNARLQELTQDAEPPYSFAGSGRGSFTRNPDFYNLGAIVQEGGITRALEVLLREAERVRRHGFTETELARQKADLLRFFDQAYNERDKTESRRFVSEYIRHFLEDEPAPGIDFEYETANRLVPGIQLEEVNAIGRQLITPNNRVVLADGPKKEGLTYPTSDELLAVFDRIASEEIEPYEDRVSDEPLIGVEPAAGSITSDTAIDEVGVTRLTLSNGARVVLKPTDFKNDEILFAAHSPGGTSLVDDADYVPADFADVLIGQGGVGSFGPIELDKKLAGKVVSMSPFIGELSEGLRGRATPEDLETLFQLAHLYVVAPRADATAYESYKQRIGGLLLSMKADPNRAFRDTVSVTMSQYHPRRKPFDEQTLAALDLDRSFTVYKDRFADAGDFTFYIVGAFDVDEVKPLIESYLASLPSAGRDESWRDVGVRPPDGMVEKTVYKGLEPKSQVFIQFNREAEWTNRERRVLAVLDNVLTIKLREVLREDLGGTYGVSVFSSFQRRPYEAASVTVTFGCDPNRADELTNIVYSVLDSVRTDLVKNVYLQKTRETMVQAQKVGLEENGSWLQWLQFYDQNDLDIREIPTALTEFLNSITLEEIRAAARKYLDPTNVARFTLYPEEQQAGESQ